MNSIFLVAHIITSQSVTHQPEVGALPHTRSNFPQSPLNPYRLSNPYKCPSTPTILESRGSPVAPFSPPQSLFHPLSVTSTSTMPAATRSSGSHQTDKATTTKATTTKAASAKAKDPLAGSRKRKDRSNEDADVEIAAPTQPVSKRTARKGKAASGPTTVTPVANTSPEDEATGNPQPNVDSADLNQDAPAPPAGPSDVASTRSGPASTNPGDQDERSALVGSYIPR